MENNEQNVHSVEINRLHDTVKSMILSTSDANGGLETSYSPYVFYNNFYYILASDLSPHSHNIKFNENIGLLIIDDESVTKNIYARVRLSYKAVARVVDRGFVDFDNVVSVLKARAGKTVDLLVSMNGFNLYKISPTEGRLVTGFGKAYVIDFVNDTATHVNNDYLKSN